ncbi:hypothetical protein SAMN05444401_0145 [Clostridium amylolyticum]|uniref:Uncharacterized protein n=1 Tax=Clostridium amylolyticum TaxID=1121298 RepID=A0A1M6N8Z2_9CLOT|nr:hypothetical protein SAMN05444401_0145 [Clostridium amylolyticum]
MTYGVALLHRNKRFREDDYLNYPTKSFIEIY